VGVVEAAAMTEPDREMNAEEVRALIERGVKRSRVSDRVIGLAVTFVIAGSIGGMGLAVSASASKELARAERALCQRVLSDRIGTIRLREVEAAASRKVAENTSLGAEVRRARRAEAEALQASIDGLRMRADPANGGRLVCADEFPDPGLF
jgi:hypothetical protein